MVICKSDHLKFNDNNTSGIQHFVTINLTKQKKLTKFLNLSKINVFILYIYFCPL